jgi:hypothetical protein
MAGRAKPAHAVEDRIDHAEKPEAEVVFFQKLAILIVIGRGGFAVLAGFGEAKTKLPEQLSVGKFLGGDL